MITNSSLLIVGSLEVSVVYKDIKNLHISLLPPSGSVRVSAPHGTSEDLVRTFVAAKFAWIKKRQQNYKDQSRQTQRKYISGETHYYLGKPYRLKVLSCNDKNELTLIGKKRMLLKTKEDVTIEKKEQVFNTWYRNELRLVLDELIKKWQTKIDVNPSHWRIQRMKTLWGSCNHESRRIVVNLELIKKPYNCIEYVVVHEWLHLIEPKHDKKFVALLDTHLPKWRQAKEELNRFILTYEKW